MRPFFLTMTTLLYTKAIKNDCFEKNNQKWLLSEGIHQINNQNRLFLAKTIKMVGYFISISYFCSRKTLKPL